LTLKETLALRAAQSAISEVLALPDSIVHTVYIDMHNVLTISQADRRPMYLQIMEQIRHRVAVGDWLPGQEIPSIRTMAIDLRVSVITVKRAYLELEHAGVIVTRQGRGTFVAENVNIGTSLKEEELGEHLEAAAEIAELLGLEADELEARLRKAHRQVAKRKQ
jgi:GntR family transcriptional regulator